MEDESLNLPLKYSYIYIYTVYIDKLLVMASFYSPQLLNRAVKCLEKMPSDAVRLMT